MGKIEGLKEKRNRVIIKRGRKENQIEGGWEGKQRKGRVRRI